MINRIIITILFCNLVYTLHSKSTYNYDKTILDGAVTCIDSTPTYYPMAIEGANWVYKIKDEGAISYYGWRIQGDTLINDLIYKKGYRTTVNVVTAPPYQSLDYSINPDFPDFFIRDDSIQKKVYVISQQLSNDFNCSQPTSTEQEKLIYDFNVQIDSSVYNSDCQMIVTDIDTLEYFGFILPRIKLGYNTIQYQQIGDQRGLFYDIRYFWVASYFEELIEYCISDEVGCPHDLPLSSNEVSNNDRIRIYPNPATDKITIKAEEIIRSIRIYSLNGSLISNNLNINVEQVDLELSQTNSQILVILIDLQSGSQTRKILHKH